MSNGAFTLPLIYSITIAGGTATVSASTFSGGSNLTVASGDLAGGFFIDPVTNVKYTCVINDTITFVDSNNTYKYASGKFEAKIPISTGLKVATKQSSTPTGIYPMANDQFTTSEGTTYTVKSVAYTNSSGPYFPITHGRFFPDPHLGYTLKGPGVSKGYVISSDDEFSINANVVYTINASNVVKSTNQVTLSGCVPNQTLVTGSTSYSLDSTASVATIKPDNLSYNEETDQFTVSYNGINVKYGIVRNGKGFSARDDRVPSNSFGITATEDLFTFKDTLTKVVFTFDPTENEPIEVGFVYTNNFFIDILNGVTFYIDVPDSRVEAISYLPETTQYGFTVDNKTYLIHYNEVGVVFPVISGANVNVGVSRIGSDIFTVHVDEIDAVDGPGIPVNFNSFEINNNVYTIAGTPSGGDYTGCQVIGHGTKSVINRNRFSQNYPS
jgi:hypothetical protein